MAVFIGGIGATRKRKLKFEDFMGFARSYYMSGAAPDEYPSDRQVLALAKRAYYDYIRGREWEHHLI